MTALLPVFDANTFQPETEINNPYFPLSPGNILSYQAEEDGDVVESNQVFVTFDTKDILGVTTTVVRDVAWDEGVLVEDTFDWYAQDTDGNVWYLGEIATNYEYDDESNFIGTNNGGSWEAGVDGAQPGYIMPAVRQVGDRYYQEFYEGEAEDEAIVLAINESITTGLGTFDQVLKTRDFTALEPDQFEHKYYAPGIGQILADEGLTRAGGKPELSPELVDTSMLSPAVLSALPTATFSNGSETDNEYFPLTSGSLFVYAGQEVDDGEEEDLETGQRLVFVTDATKDILGITARVVRDSEFENGQLIEDTLAYYAQDDAGNVWLLGESTTEYEYNRKGRVREVEKEEWLAGQDENLPGFVITADPEEGDRFYQRFQIGDEADEALVLGEDESAGEIADILVEETLDVKEFSALEPDEFDIATYAENVGLVAQQEFEDDELEFISELTEFRDLGATVLPDFVNATFEAGTPIDNAYFPLTPGSVYSYAADVEDEETGDIIQESNQVFVLNKTKNILGIEAQVIRDRAYVDGVLVEDTFDWYAQDTDGNVWYLGELATNYEYDEDGNLIDTNTDGSWQAGVDGALPGIIMPAMPEVGADYYQEFFIGEAEDEGQILSVDETIIISLGTYTDVLKTFDTTALEPDAQEFKYYAPGIGQILGEELDEEGEPEVVPTLINIEAFDQLRFGDDVQNTVSGHKGNDYMDGGAGNDELKGKHGDDILLGGLGQDMLWGNAGDDSLYGGQGDDWLNGGLGNDIYTGSEGTDQFVLAKGQGVDIITDFEFGIDQIVLGKGLQSDGVHLFEATSDTLVLTSQNELLGIVQGTVGLGNSVFA
jgi:Ca2+-binding RTX toxin-like protein